MTIRGRVIIKIAIIIEKEEENEWIKSPKEIYEINKWFLPIAII